MANRKKLSKASADKLEAFDSAARTHGWQQDQGIGKSVINAENDYTKSKEELTKRMLYLENKCKRLDRLVKRYEPSIADDC